MAGPSTHSFRGAGDSHRHALLARTCLSQGPTNTNLTSKGYLIRARSGGIPRVCLVDTWGVSHFFSSCHFGTFLDRTIKIM